MTRFILLREFPPNLDIEQTPEDDYFNGDFSGLQQKPFRIRTDANGFILSGNESGASAANIVAIGDSVCENLYVDEDKRLWSELSRGLSRQLARPIEVLNAGVSGNHLLHVINALMNKIVPLRPEAVIFLGGVVDRLAAANRMSYWSRNPEVCTIVQKSKVRADFSERPVDFAEMRHLLELLGATCTSFDIPVIFLTVPFPRSLQSDYYRVLMKSNEMIRYVCRSRNFPLIDLEDLFGDSPAYVYDEIHLNEAGSLLVAQAILASGVIQKETDERIGQDLRQAQLGVR